MNGKQKQIYFREKDMDVYDYLKLQPNASQYLIRLIRDDMRKPKGATWEAVLRALARNPHLPSERA